MAPWRICSDFQEFARSCVTLQGMGVGVRFRHEDAVTWLRRLRARGPAGRDHGTHRSVHRKVRSQGHHLLVTVCLWFPRAFVSRDLSSLELGRAEASALCQPVCSTGSRPLQLCGCPWQREGSPSCDGMRLCTTGGICRGIRSWHLGLP